MIIKVSHCKHPSMPFLISSFENENYSFEQGAIEGEAIAALLWRHLPGTTVETIMHALQKLDAEMGSEAYEKSLQPALERCELK